MNYILSGIYAIKTIVAASIFFVWVVRYREIIEEFKLYELPSWLRDLVGILKLSFAFMLFSNDMYVTIFGASGIIFLMAAAVFTHIRVKNPFYKMLPAFGLIALNLIIILFIYK
jgi:Ca2+/Na+ antiporter